LSNVSLTKLLQEQSFSTGYRQAMTRLVLHATFDISALTHIHIPVTTSSELQMLREVLVAVTSRQPAVFLMNEALPLQFVKSGQIGLSDFYPERSLIFKGIESKEVITSPFACLKKA
jgi:hypothetical protein